MAKILIGTPVAGLEVTTAYMMSMVSLVARLFGSRPDVSLMMRDPISGPLLSRARNAYATLVLQDPTITHLLFIDSDIGFRPEAVLKLLDSGKDLVGCLYPVRKPTPPGQPQPFVCESAIVTREDGALVSEQGFVRMRYIGGGLTLISRTVIERIRDAFPGLLAAPDEVYRWWGVQDRVLQCFDPLQADGQLSSGEDTSFCERWRVLGGEIWALIDEEIVHVGPAPFAGRFLDRVRPPAAAGT